VWRLACSLFARPGPTLIAALSARERAALPALQAVRAVKPQVVDARFVLCPYCQLQRGPVVREGTDESSRLLCRCPECGPVPVDTDDLGAVAFDVDWLLRKLRLALEVAGPASTSLGAGLWRLGHGSRGTVLLARSLDQVLLQPDVLERVRERGSAALWLLTPQPLRHVDAALLGRGILWLSLEERFTFYGGKLNFLADASGAATEHVDDAATAPWHGPFARDFRWVHLPDWPHGPIGLTKMQAAVFQALWTFGGDEQEAYPIMGKAGSGSDKPIDVFKVKARNKGDPQYEGPRYAYQQLVVTHQRTGTYAMPCALSGTERNLVVAGEGGIASTVPRATAGPNPNGRDRPCRRPPSSDLVIEID
jgi:hypothetical protein